ncbi:MAG: tetratricopeptide repeat protein [Treponema sp.]|nr:tetratricopeptide repeat protein [Treponema sp.]
MRLDPTLSMACRLARSGKYEAALNVLLPEVTRYNRSFIYFRIMGTVCLYSGEFGNALTYFRLAKEEKPDDGSVLLGLAALYMRRGDSGMAVALYLDVLKGDPANRRAKKAMALIRRQAGTEAFSLWLESGRLVSLYPPVPFPGFSAKAVALVAGAALSVLAGAFALTVWLGFVANPFRTFGGRELPPELSLTWEDRAAPVTAGDAQAFLLDRGQAIAAYETALALFSDHRDEAARVFLNRLLLSNAADTIKNRARRMLSEMVPPGFDTFRREDNVNYAEVWQEPQLYRGVHVVWRGIASNVSISDRGTSFDFLLGHNAPLRVEGMVQVVFDQPVPLPEDAIEVLGRIVPTGNEGRLRLEGIAIRINL